MRYPAASDLKKIAGEIELYVQLKHEHGARGISPILSRAERALRGAVRYLRALRPNPAMARREPNGLRAIRALRPRGPRRIWSQMNLSVYRERLEGGLLGRMAGCTLGAPVEFWPIEKMKALAEETGQAFPPVDYWTYVPEPKRKRYQTSPVESYTRRGMRGVPVDDDLAYTLLGLLIVEDFGIDFTTRDVARAWLKYLPHACSAEHVALENLKKGIPAARAGECDNPYREWIGADIRSDPWGYLAPGWPERAAEMAYRDAFLSHRRQGIYGEMFFSAAVSAAFTVDDPIEAIRVGLTEIPRDCALARAVRWALRVSPRIRNYRQARDAMEKRFKGMSGVHTINNACLTVWGIGIGDAGFSRVIGETVAMGMDNDCTAATAGSIVGAAIGRKGIPGHWRRRFDDTIHSYLKGKRRFSIRDVLARFERQAVLIADH